MIRDASNSSTPVMSVEAELATPAVNVQIADLEVVSKLEADVLEPGVYRLDLCLGPRCNDARLCFIDHWPPHRFEEPGKLFLLPPGQALRARSGVGRQRLLLCRLREESVQSWLSENRHWTRSRIEASLDVNSHSIKHLLLRLGQEARAPSFASETLAEAIGVQIAVEVERYYIHAADPCVPGSLARWRLQVIDDRLRAANDPPTLSELASLCEISVRQLARGFRASRGISIGKHVSEVRLDNAKRLLTTGSGIKTVAFAVGFKSVTSFCFAFRTATGLTPREYQQRAGHLLVRTGE